MSTGDSGFSNPAFADLLASTAPPLPPVDLTVTAVGLQGTGAPNELPKITLQFKKPVKKELTVTDAATDDIYDTGYIASYVAADAGVGSKDIFLTSNPIGLIAIGDRVLLGLQTTRYIVDGVYSNRITILYGLLGAIAIGEDCRRIAMIQECPTTSRTLRLNATIGATCYIYAAQLYRKTMWTTTSYLGSWEDKNKVLSKVQESNRTYTADNPRSGPLGMVIAGGSYSAGGRAVNVNFNCTAYIFPGDHVSFGDADTMYEVDTVSLLGFSLKTALTSCAWLGDMVWKRDDSPTAFTDYQTLLIADYYGRLTLSDLFGYRLYMNYIPATQGAKGVQVEEVAYNAATLSTNANGLVTYIYNAPNANYDGRLMFFSLTAIDKVLPTQNESQAALNAYVVTYPGQADITSYANDVENLTMTVTYERLTANSMNPHLFEFMDQATAQFSKRGGYDLFARMMTPLVAGAGFYQGIDATHGKFVDAIITTGDQVKVVDLATRSWWDARAIVASEVSLDDTILTYGTPGMNYMTAHLSANFAAYRVKFNVATDSVLPYDISTPAFPEKQYLTDLGNQYVVNFATPGNYAVAIEAVDTGIAYGKL